MAPLVENLAIEKPAASRTAAGLTDEMNGWQAASNTCLANLLELVAVYDRGVLWRADGATSMAGWLTFQYGLSLRTATAWVETAGALVELPFLRDASQRPGDLDQTGRNALPFPVWALTLRK